MKKITYLLLLILWLNHSWGQTLNQKFYLDFGPNDVTNGENTISPDKNGNYWNNINSITLNNSVSNLINSANTASTYSVTITAAGFSTNGKLHGGLLTPFASQLTDNEDFAIAKATQDYFFVGSTTASPSFTLKGLDKTKQYRFKIFGSRNVVADRTSNYKIEGATNSEGTLKTSTTSGLGGTVYVKPGEESFLNVNYSATSSSPYTSATTYKGNNSSVFTSELIYPNSNGEIKITLTTANNTLGYINAVKIEEFLPVKQETTSIEIDGQNISQTAASSQLSVIYTPADATKSTVTWSVNDQSIATIDANGLLTAKKNGEVIVTASITQNDKTISATKSILISNQFEKLYVFGKAISNESALENALELKQSPNLAKINTGIFEIFTNISGNESLRFVTNKDLTATVYGKSSSDGTLKIDGEPITTNLTGDVLIRVNLSNSTYSITQNDEFKIAQMGSSVSYGYGATDSKGYAYQYNQLLNELNTSNKGSKFYISNISVGGNKTTDLLKRWDTDLLNLNSKYVVYALSLANEGILSGGQEIVDQFKNNLLLLIEKAKSVGKIPIVTNVYANQYYNATHYNYVKQMNLIIHQWDIPSTNLLGGLDNGTGNWVNGYSFDSAHPNTDGHTEMFYSLVPSLFEALHNNKPAPSLKTDTYLEMGTSKDEKTLQFTPENKVHSFTVSIDIKTTKTGVIANFKENQNSGTLKIDSQTGYLSYTSPNGNTISGQKIVNDGQWHKITLTHYYAWGKTIIYQDAIELNRLDEKLEPSDFAINLKDGPSEIDYRNWFFYRAGMNQDEVSALNDNKMLKSSLELYAPLNGQTTNDLKLINLAQSTNTIQEIGTSLDIEQVSKSKKFGLLSNPVKQFLSLTGVNINDSIKYIIYDISGKKINSETTLENNDINVSYLEKGIYFIQLQFENSRNTLKFIKQ